MVDPTWMSPERWEHGSYSILPVLDSHTAGKSVFEFACQVRALMVGSGRVALGLVIENGIRNRGWRRLWVPSYYCEDVMDYLAGLGITLARYSCGPWGQDSHPKGGAGDVLLRVNYFGWGIRPLAYSFEGDVIEDHTHAPAAGEQTTADFVVASLRKVLQVPDGGLCWSPVGHALPVEPSLMRSHDATASARLGAMALKRAYLSGYGDESNKQLVRTIELSTEASLLAGERSAIASWTRMMLSQMSLEKATEIRLRNLQILSRSLKDYKCVDLLGPDECSSPMVAVLQMLNSSVRDAVRAKLINRRIYPAVLWPIQKPQEEIMVNSFTFSSKVLMLHIDERYTEVDMEHVAHEVGRAVSEVLAI